MPSSRWHIHLRLWSICVLLILAIKQTVAQVEYNAVPTSVNAMSVENDRNLALLCYNINLNWHNMSPLLQQRLDREWERNTRQLFFQQI